MANDNNSIYAAAIQGAANIAGASFAAADSKAARKWQAEQAQINRDFQRDERLATQEFNLDMWNLTNDWNLAQWHRQNEYDSPQAQLERARAAGINPNTAIGSMYGGGSASLSASPISSSPMSGSMASYSDGLASSIMSSFSQLGVNTANMLNTLADRDTKQYWLSYDQMTEAQRKKILDATADNLIKDLDVKDVNIETAKVVLGNLAEMKEQELLNLRLIAKQIEAGTRSTEAAIERDDRTADANIAYVEQLTKQSEEQTESQSLINEFTKAVGAPQGTPEYLFVKKLADEKKLSEFLDGAYKPLERARWKPSDYYVTVDTYDEGESTIDTKMEYGPLKVLHGDVHEIKKSKSHKRKTLRYDYSYPADSTVVNPHP